jgi:hypothetical protein
VLNEWMTVNDEYDVAGNCRGPECPRKTTGNLSYDRRCPGRDSNVVPSESQSEALILGT